MDILAIARYPEINIQNFFELGSAFFLAYALNEIKTLLLSK